MGLPDVRIPESIAKATTHRRPGDGVMPPVRNPGPADNPTAEKRKYLVSLDEAPGPFIIEAVKLRYDDGMCHFHADGYEVAAVSLRHVVAIQMHEPVTEDAPDLDWADLFYRYVEAARAENEGAIPFELTETEHAAIVEYASQDWLDDNFIEPVR